jgi:hypothetical protein
MRALAGRLGRPIRLDGAAGDFVKVTRRPRRLPTLCLLGILLNRGGADEEIEENTHPVVARVAQRL